jgi:predicted Rossmann-fold nucleotide-binding protein
MAALGLWRVADGVLNGGGIVIGVIPDFKIKRNRSQWTTELIVVDSMHEGNENE